MSIAKDGVDIMHASKYAHENLWHINLSNLLEYDSLSRTHLDSYARTATRKQHITQQGYAHLAVHSTSAAEQVLWMSECMGSIPDVTIIRALRSGIFTFHGITHEMYSKNRPNSIITSLGHMKATRQGIQSTRKAVKQRKRVIKSPSDTVDIVKEEEETEHDPPTIEGDDDEAYISVISLKRPAPRPDRNHIAQADASGRVPVRSISGNNYVLITVFRNYIKFNAFSDRSSTSYAKLFKEVTEFINSKKPKELRYQRIDGETSREVEEYFTKHLPRIDILKAPPSQHRTNSAERAMQTAKYHLRSIWSGADAACPKYLWDKALPQAELTLNQVRPYSMNNSISAWTGLWGSPFDFDAYPIAPWGTNVLAFVSPSDRETHAEHGLRGFYMGCAFPEFYRCHRVYITATKGFRVTDTVQFFPARVMVPGSSFENRIELALDKLTQIFAQIATARGTMPEFHRDNFNVLTETTLQSLSNMSDIWATHRDAHPPQAVPQQRVGAQPPQPPPAIPILPPAAHDQVQQQRVGTPPAQVQASPVRIIPLLPPGLVPPHMPDQSPPPRQLRRVRVQTPLFSYTSEVQRAPTVTLSAITINNGNARTRMPPNITASTKALAIAEECNAKGAYYRNVLSMIAPLHAANMIKTSHAGRTLTERVPTIVTTVASINNLSSLDAYITGNNTGGGRSKVRTGMSTIPNAGKGLFYSARESANIGDVICLYEHERTRYATERRARTTQSTRIMEGPPSTNTSGRYFIGKDKSYGTFANDPLDESLCNAKFHWNSTLTRWELVATQEIEQLHEIFVEYGENYWRQFQNILTDKTKLYDAWPALRADLPTHPRAQLPPLSKTQARQRALGVVRNLDASNISSDKYEDNGPPDDMFNIDMHGNPLTHRSAMKDEARRATFMIADEDEWTRLLGPTYKCMDAIHKHEVPADRFRDVTYYNPQVKEKRTADGVYQARVRGTVGGNLTHYTGEVASHVAAMAAIKCMLNSVVSTPDGKFMSIDLKDFYLQHDLDRPEFMKVPISKIPDNTIRVFQLDKYKDNKNFVYFRIKRAIYGLPQAAILSRNALVKLLNQHEYYESDGTIGLFTHATRPLAFTLVVDDIGVKYVDKADVEHLISALTTKYSIATDWVGKKYLGYTISHDTDKHTLALQMPNFIPNFFNWACPDGVPPAKVGSPMLYVQQVYGATGPTYAHEPDESPLLDAHAQKRTERIVGALLYYAIAQDNTYLPAVCDIAREQKHATQNTLKKVERLLGYAAKYPNNILEFKRSDMILKAYSDGSYQSLPDSRSMAGGFFFCGNNNNHTFVNGPVDAMSAVIRSVLSSAGDCEYASLFLTATRSIPHIQTLIALGHPQPAAGTPILVDNSFAVGLVNDKIKAKHSKAIDMRFHWTRDRVRQGQFQVLWCEGINQVADFFTKALPVWKHKKAMHYMVRVPHPTDGSTSPVGSAKHVLRSQACIHRHRTHPTHPTSSRILYHVH